MAVNIKEAAVEISRTRKEELRKVILTGYAEGKWDNGKLCIVYLTSLCGSDSEITKIVLQQLNRILRLNKNDVGDFNNERQTNDSQSSTQQLLSQKRKLQWIQSSMTTKKKHASADRLVLRLEVLHGLVLRNKILMD